MRRAVGALLVLVFGLVVPSVVIWVLGGPWWVWAAIVVGVGLAVMLLYVFFHLNERYPGSVALLFAIIYLVFVFPGFVGSPWWSGMAVLGGILGVLVVGAIVWYGFIMMLGRD